MVVPYGELQGWIERFEAERTVNAIVRDRAGAAPRRSDESVLSGVYRREIRPTIDELEASFDRTLANLFGKLWSTSCVAVGGTTTSSAGLLKTAEWSQTNEQNIVTTGFRLSDRRKLEFRHVFDFGGYTGKGRRSFSFAITAAWSLGAVDFQRTVTLNSEPVPQFTARIRYDSREGQYPDLDRTVAAVLEVAIREVTGR